MIFGQLEKLEAAKAAYSVCLCLLGFSGFWVLPGLLGPSVSFYVLLDLTRPYWALLTLTKPYWALLDFTVP